jgi:hypothetical protein
MYLEIPTGMQHQQVAAENGSYLDGVKASFFPPSLHNNRK